MATWLKTELGKNAQSESVHLLILLIGSNQWANNSFNNSFNLHSRDAMQNFIAPEYNDYKDLFYSILRDNSQMIYQGLRCDFTQVMAELPAGG